MNCKQGDLAIVVSGAAVGFVVTCIERYDGPWFEQDHAIGWRVDIPLPKLLGGSRQPFILDSALRPIRPGEGEDEMLLLAGKPEGVTA
jgi:hypothetical protein